MEAFKSLLTAVVVVLFFCVDVNKCDELLGEEIFDLSWPYGNDTIFWPGVRRFEYTKKHAGAGAAGGWYSANEFCTGEHVGTHLDAPYHFNKNGETVEQIPITKLIAKGITVDIKDEVERFGTAARLQPKHLDDWESSNGPIPDKCVLLVRFGWSKHYHNPAVYLGGRDDHKLDFPGISSEAAAWIVNTKKIVGVGVDTASADPGRNHSYEAHKIFADNQIYILENVNVADELPVKDFTLFVMPMKLTGGTGAPVRIVALPNAQLLPQTAALNEVDQVPLAGHLLVFVSVGVHFGMKMMEWI